MLRETVPPLWRTIAPLTSQDPVFGVLMQLGEETPWPPGAIEELLDRSAGP